MILAVIAQFKFAATYMVPGAWSAVIFVLSSALASLTTLFHLPIGVVMPLPGTEWPFVLNVLFWLLVLNAIAGLTYTLLKIFGRKPSINEILSGLVSIPKFKDYQEEQRLRCVGLETQISAARHAFDERANSDLVQTTRCLDDLMSRGKARDDIIATMGREMAAMQERTKTHIRQFDTLFQKCDRLLERLPRQGFRDPTGD